jgi:hypothetical protein
MLTVKSMSQQPLSVPSRRRYPRYPVTGELRASRIPLMGFQVDLEQVVEGELENISSGGLCVLTTGPMEISDVFRTEIGLPSVPISIPVLSDVRWIERLGEHLYRVGLRFAV